VHRTDAVVIQKVLAGDKRAYAELVDRHKEKAMTLALRLLKNREDAEEAIQDAFVRAFNALPRFEWKSSFSTWFYRIVYNVCLTQLGRRGEELQVSIDAGAHEEGIEVASEEMPPDLQYESVEFEQIVVREIETLPILYGSICTLFFVQEMSYDQIAEVTGLPLGTVKVRLFRGRLILRNEVAKRLGVVKASAM
jgi:RNA polymerase sigma-70 factor (ECF subfamily)